MKIIVNDECEKEELLKMCQYLHDFSVIFKKMSKRNKVEVIKSFDKSIPSEKITNFKKYCGVSLDFELFSQLQLLVALYDSPDEIRPDIIKETIIIKPHKNIFQF